MTRIDPKLETLLGQAFDYWDDSPDTPERQTRRLDFVFHMTDWINDLPRLNAILQNPGGEKPDQVAKFIWGFLIHAVPHLRAAGRAIEGKEITDPFLPQFVPTHAGDDA